MTLLIYPRPLVTLNPHPTLNWLLRRIYPLRQSSVSPMEINNEIASSSNVENPVKETIVNNNSSNPQVPKNNNNNNNNNNKKNQVPLEIGQSNNCANYYWSNGGDS
nr:PREDICTED: putative uncharacterized protein DDB_G0289981 [Bemisia tabaci]XP_018909059.1 PREDICTED: putative uncharacterized protein DDB_G0289981 [Bemisia tabaci]